MFFRKKRQTVSYDPALMRPAIKCSICTGEQVAGFQELSTGRFEEIMLIRDGDDLKKFREKYGIDTEIIKIY